MTPKKLIGIILARIVSIFFSVVGIFATMITLLAPLHKSKSLPKISSELLKISAKKLTTKIKNKEVKCVDVMEAYIARIRDVNPVINSIVQARFSEALSDAANVDNMIECCDDIDELIKDKPLLGIPLTVKESIGVKGLSHNTARSRVSFHIAEEDAECIQLLRNAGAIPLLVSNTPELCCYFETYSYKIGQTNNPYDTRRTCSGSSGGEASLLGAGASLIGVGSDLSGSLRTPAMFCGVFSHKPSPGFIPNTGHIPTSSDTEWDKYFTVGPICRYAEDIAIMLQSMVPSRNHIERLRLNEPVDLKNVKIYYMYGEGKNSILQHEPNFQVKKAVKQAANILNEQYNCPTTKVFLKYFENSFSYILLLLNLKKMENVYQKSDENPEDYDLLRILEVLFKRITFQTTTSFPSLMLIPLQFFGKLIFGSFMEKIQKRTEKGKKTILELLSNDGVLIYPTFPVEAQFHNRMCGQVVNISYCSIFNILGLPVTQCHVRFTREGLPVGVQIVAAPENDRLCIAVAQAISSVTGGWQPPESVTG